MSFFFQKSNPQYEALPLTSPSDQPSPSSSSPSPSPSPPTSSCIVAGSACRVRGFLCKNKDNCAFSLLVFLLVSLSALSTIALWSPWYVASVDFMTCSAKVPLSHNWFHKFHSRFDRSVLCQNQDQDQDGPDQVLVPLTFALHSLSQGHFGPTLFPRGAVDSVYAITFVLACSAAVATLLASMLFFIRLVRPACRPEGMKFMSMTILFLAFLFSLLAVICFSVAQPIASHHECGHPQTCLKTSKKFFDSTAYFAQIPSGGEFRALDILVNFHPSHGWYFSLSVAISLFLVFLVSIFLDPSLKQLSPVPIINQKEELSNLQSLVC